MTPSQLSTAAAAAHPAKHLHFFGHVAWIGDLKDTFRYVDSRAAQGLGALPSYAAVRGLPTMMKMMITNRPEYFYEILCAKTLCPL